MARAISISPEGAVTEVDIDLSNVVETVGGKAYTVKVPSIHDQYPKYSNEVADDIQPVLLARHPGAVRGTLERNLYATALFVPKEQRDHEFLSGDVLVVDMGEDEDWEDRVVALRPEVTVESIESLVQEAQD